MKHVWLFAALLTSPALAATPSSWTALDRDARAACGRDIVHQAAKAKVTGKAGMVRGIGIGSEADRHYALILTGTTAGYRSQWLCLYDKRAKRAAAREIEK
ncbi:MAG TPA: hypothetical protein VHM27_03250 [Rhizomicrobium sp.]|nr:hypothetical protein [Rhizomicrobium sp.]